MALKVRPETSPERSPRRTQGSAAADGNLSLAFERAHSLSLVGMDHDEALRDALRLAVDPPGGVCVESLRELARDDDATEWDIATTAAHLAVSPHTLRYYERIGLVRVERDHSGHRRYDAPAVRRLVFLTRMRTSGMSISDLRHYIDLVDAGDTTVRERLDLLLEHRDTLRAQIAQLQLALAATEYKIATYQGAPQP